MISCAGSVYSTDPTQEACPRLCRLCGSHPATWARSYRPGIFCLPWMLWMPWKVCRSWSGNWCICPMCERFHRPSSSVFRADKVAAEWDCPSHHLMYLYVHTHATLQGDVQVPSFSAAQIHSAKWLPYFFASPPKLCCFLVSWHAPPWGLFVCSVAPTNCFHVQFWVRDRGTPAWF